MKKLVLVLALLVLPVSAFATGNHNNPTCPQGQHWVDTQFLNHSPWIVLGHCENDPTPPPVDLCPNIDGTQATIPEGKEIVGGVCVDIVVVPPTDVCPNIEGDQATMPEGKELVEGICVDIVETPEEPPVCSESEHLEENVCVPNETTPPVDETPSTPAPSSNGGGGGSQGGHRKCGIPGLPTCEDWVKGITTPSTSVDANVAVKLQLIDLMKQLIKLLQLKISQLPPDFKG